MWNRHIIHLFLYKKKLYYRSFSVINFKVKLKKGGQFKTVADN